VARLIGTHSATFDSKNRLTVPVIVRPALGDRVVIAGGPDPCALVYPDWTWRALEEAVLRLPPFDEEAAWVKRAFGDCAEERAIDDQGRLMVSERIREVCGLESRTVIIVGVFDKLEIWDRDAYDRLRAERVTPRWRRDVGNRLQP